MTVTVRKFVPTDLRLGRHVRHDSRSLNYAVDTSGLTVQKVLWNRNVPIFDQGSLGSCTGNAGIGCMGTGPNYGTVPITPYSFDEPGAVALYSDATKLDSDPKNYPPDDTGSDGLSIAGALKNHGKITGYQHVFNEQDAMKALTLGPLIFGTVWYQSMFNPDSNGVVTVTPSSGIAGGHEIVVVGYDPSTDFVELCNSWGTGWGKNGHFFLKLADFGTLLADQGDVILFTPVVVIPPIPPIPPASTDDAQFAAVLKPWVAKRHVGANAVAAKAAVAWMKAKGL